MDEAFVDCGAAGCETGPSGTYQEIGASGCESGACVDPEPNSCGEYSCADGGCLPDLPDGGVCDEDSDCVSGNCQNGFCCGAGLTCCNADADCPGSPGVGTVCDPPADCRGSRGTIMCNTSTFAWETVSGVAVEIREEPARVGQYTRVAGTVVGHGTADQPRPRCPGPCTADAECDDNAHCDIAFCFPDLPDGESCDEASDCVSGHCQNGFCCASGDCCRNATDCGGYGAPATCDDERACQGTRDAAVCASSICGTSVDVADDSACTAMTVASGCGLYPSVRCSGAAEQSAPSCADSCAGDSECDEAAHCDGGACTPDLPNGDACDEASDFGAFCNESMTCQSEGMMGDACGDSSECAGSLAYIDGVCCTGSCTGACEACNVPGSLGACSPIPAGEDPAGECGAVDCSGYFSGQPLRRDEGPAGGDDRRGDGQPHGL